jgi:hypothetical protein
MSQHTSHLSAHVKHDPTSSHVPAASSSPGKKAAGHAEIAQRAYEKFEARGRMHGFDREDWIAASHELIDESFGHPSLSSSRALSALPDSKPFRGA